MFITSFFLIASLASSKSNMINLLCGLLIGWMSSWLERWEAGCPDNPPPLLQFLSHILLPIDLYTPPNKRRVLDCILSLASRQSRNISRTSRIQPVWLHTSHQSFDLFEPR